MERKEAIALLKELSSNHLVQPSLVVLKENKDGTFDLAIKGDYNAMAIKVFISDKKLVLIETGGTGTIYKP